MAALSFLIRSLALVVFNPSLVAMLLRAAVLFLVSFFLAPLLYAPLSRLTAKIQLFILSVVVIELIALKVGRPAAKSPPAKGEAEGGKPGSGKKIGAKFIDGNMKKLLANKQLLLLLHTNSVDVKNLVPRHLYLPLQSLDLSEHSMELFEHEARPMLAVELVACRQLLKDTPKQSELYKVFKAIKASDAKRVYFAFDIQDLTALSAQRELLNKVKSSAALLGSYLGKTWDISLVIDNMQAVEGFAVFAHFAQSVDPAFLSIVLPINLKDEQLTLDVYERALATFSRKIDDIIRSSNFANPRDAQAAVVFSQQIHYLKPYLRELVMALVKVAKPRFSGKQNNVFFEIHFLSSIKTPKSNVEVISQELRKCFTGQENARPR